MLEEHSQLIVITLITVIIIAVTAGFIINDSPSWFSLGQKKADELVRTGKDAVDFNKVPISIYTITYTQINLRDWLSPWEQENLLTTIPALAGTGLVCNQGVKAGDVSMTAYSIQINNVQFNTLYCLPVEVDSASYCRMGFVFHKQTLDWSELSNKFCCDISQKMLEEEHLRGFTIYFVYITQNVLYEGFIDVNGDVQYTKQYYNSDDLLNGEIEVFASFNDVMELGYYIIRQNSTYQKVVDWTKAVGEFLKQRNVYAQKGHTEWQIGTKGGFETVCNGEKLKVVVFAKKESYVMKSILKYDRQKGAFVFRGTLHHSE